MLNGLLKTQHHLAIGHLISEHGGSYKNIAVVYHFKVGQFPLLLLNQFNRNLQQILHSEGFIVFHTIYKI